MSEIKQSLNEMQIVGAVEEVNLEFLKDQKVELRRGDFKKEVVCDTVDFRNSSMTVRVERKDEDGNSLGETIIPVELRTLFNQNSKSLNDKGEVEENKGFKALETIATYEKGTRVQVTTRADAIQENGYAGRDGWTSRPRFIAQYVTSTNVPEEDKADAKITGVIRSIKPEIKNEEETGRLFVEFYMFNYKGDTYPVTLAVNEDLADDFKDAYELGASCQLDVELVSRTVGKPKVNKEKAFGRRASKIVEGYIITEINVFGGDPVFEEENEYFVDIKDMKKAIEARELMIEQKIKDKAEKDKGGNTAKPKGLGQRRAVIEDVEDEESPF